MNWLYLEDELIKKCKEKEYHEKYKKVLVDGIEKKKQEAVNMPGYG